MKRFSERLVAATVFVTALGGTLIALPLALDNPAFALDADSRPHDRPERAFPLPSERVEARLAYIKTALKITDAQTKEWNAVADVLRQQAKAHDAAIQEMQSHRDDNATIIDRMEFHQKMLAARASELSDLLAAAKPLYASLSPEQKKTADSLMGGGRFGGPGFHHGPGGPEHDGGAPGPQPD
jgi:hypothetical protein